MIIRAKHDGKSAPYVILSRRLIQENNLPHGAKCLLMLMLSYPDSWNFSETNLAATMDQDLQTIKNWLEVLVQYGYVHKNVAVPYGDSCITVDWLVTEYPMEAKI